MILDKVMQYNVRNENQKVRADVFAQKRWESRNKLACWIVVTHMAPRGLSRK